jgi:hypothetical protein
MTKIAVMNLITGIRLDLRSAMSAYFDLHTAKDAYATESGNIEKKGQDAVLLRRISSNRIIIEFNKINTVNETITKTNVYETTETCQLVTCSGGYY